MLFLVDGIGAALTGSILLTIQKRYVQHIGMPPAILAVFSLIAFVFAGYSIFCFFFVTKNPEPFLAAIAIANFAYCASTVLMVIRHYPVLTALGLAYFIIELLIIFSLAVFEWKAARMS